MKLTRTQLRRLINENLKLQNEGLWDTIKKGASWVGDKLEYGTSTEELLKKSSQDALDLYDAMSKLGTDEAKVENVMKKRSADLDKLYIEFNNLIMNWVKANATGVITSDTSIKINEFNQDLIAWLEGDGMNQEAKEVETAIKEKGVERKKVPAKVKGMFG